MKSSQVQNIQIIHVNLDAIPSFNFWPLTSGFKLFELLIFEHLMNIFDSQRNMKLAPTHVKCVHLLQLTLRILDALFCGGFI